MLFNEALEALKEGKHIRRALWSKEEGYLVLLPGIRTVWRIQSIPNVTAGNHLFLSDEFQASDWEILDVEKYLAEPKPQESDL
jgi:hypothetical protein